jgi:hypothetical protein
MFNPIVPVWARRPRSWHGAPYERATAKEILSGYIQAFDPDCLTRVGTVGNVPDSERKTVEAGDILGRVGEDGTPSYGVGLLEVIRGFHRDELRFLRQRPVEIVLPLADGRYDLFWASVFGALPPELEESILRAWGEALAPKRPTVTLANYFELLEPDKISWRRLASYRIRDAVRRVPLEADVLFLLDATSVTDIADYWNLRAAGWRVYPVAKQGVGQQELRKHLVQIVEDSFVPYRSNPDLYRHTEVVPARSCTKKETNDFIAWLDVPPPSEGVRALKLLSASYPRLWNEWSRSKR